MQPHPRPWDQMLKLSPPCPRQTAQQTPGISRNLNVYASEDGGGDLNGTGALLLRGHAGTAGSRFAVPRSLQFQSSGGNTLPEYLTEAPAGTDQPYARNGAVQAWQLLAGQPFSIPVEGVGWIANQFLNWRLLDGGASLQISGVLSRTAGNNIGPGAGNNVILCTMPIAPVTQQMQICPALAQIGLGALPGDQISYGFLLFGVNGALAFYANARNDDPPAHAGTSTVYVSNTFPLTMPGAAEFILPESASQAPPLKPAGWFRRESAKLLQFTLTTLWNMSA